MWLQSIFVCIGGHDLTCLPSEIPMELKTLYIPKTDETPEVNLSAESGNSYISGRSLPENAFEFYQPVLAWIRSYARTMNAPLHLELKFDYFNSSSGRYLFEILHVLEQSRYKEHYRIVWMVEKEDDLMYEKGEELKSLSELRFEVVEY
jgi:hypothetical protein